GRPKGVMIEHRSARHLVRAEARIFGVRPDDRVYQGASLSFDLSVEEIWLAFGAGATLVAATPEMARAGPDLARLLRDHGVTVLSCVPTLLSILAGEMPALRLLILGGEACPGWLVARWARPGRRIVNTYGPTETTVIATYADLDAGKPVTIGRAVAGYRVHLLGGDSVAVAVDADDRAAELRVTAREVARGHEQRGAGVIKDVVDPVGRVLRIDRNVGRPGLEDREQRGVGVDRALEEQGDDRPGPSAQAAQMAGEAVRAALEVGVGGLLALEDHSRGLRPRVRLRLEDLVQHAGRNPPPRVLRNIDNRQERFHDTSR
ncbi:MAG: hypothetical protein DMG07_03100, partial [Acidobacteria bacterium]